LIIELILYALDLHDVNSISAYKSKAKNSRLIGLFRQSMVFYFSSTYNNMILMTCNGVCIRYRAKRNRFAPSRYSEGQKRCSVCDIFI